MSLDDGDKELNSSAPLTSNQRYEYSTLYSVPTSERKKAKKVGRSTFGGDE